MYITDDERVSDEPKNLLFLVGEEGAGFNQHLPRRAMLVPEKSKTVGRERLRGRKFKEFGQSQKW